MGSITQIPDDHFSGQRNIAPEPDPNALDLAHLLQKLQANADGRISSHQTAAATLVENKMIAQAAGTITGVQAVAGTAAAAGESMNVDVKIGGTTVLSATLTIDNSSGTTVQNGTLDSAAVDFAAGDVISIERTYTAGGGPTPMANTLVEVAYSLD